MSEYRQLTLAEIYDLSERALLGAGASALQAAPTARSIQEAEADGIRSVGLAYLTIYCAHLKCGKVNGTAVPSFEQTAPAAMVANAHNGFAHAAFEGVQDEFMELARGQGLAGLAIVESYSAGVLAWFVERLAERGLVALGFANSSALMAPYGGSKAFFGTNPLAFAVPRAKGLPLVVDLATSQIAYVTVMAAAEKGEEIPLGWGLDKDGQPTTDPSMVIDGGSMAPVGGYKGMLLALLVDVLAGGLAGPHFAYQASSFIDDEGGPPRVGQFLLAIDPNRYAPAERTGRSLSERLESLLLEMTVEPGVRMPGDRRLKHRQQAAADGIAVPLDLISQLEGYASGKSG